MHEGLIPEVPGTKQLRKFNRFAKKKMPLFYVTFVLSRFIMSLVFVRLATTLAACCSH